MLDRPHPSRRAGFTLIEMVVVLTVLALLYAVAAPAAAPFFGRPRLEMATRDLVTALKEARSQAVVGLRDVRFTVDAESGDWRFGDRRGAARRGVSVSVEAPPLAGGRGAAPGIRFFADGGSTGGLIRLASGPHRRRIDVDWLTGRVSWREE
jgi:general secretion pathway protein H